jgi:hypothetical protein
VRCLDTDIVDDETVEAAMKYDIYCESLSEFVEVCAMLVREGVCFEAVTDEGYVIHCTGGF